MAVISRFLILFSLTIMLVQAAHAEVPEGLIDRIQMPDGFAIDVLTDEVPGARSLVVGDDDTLFVSTRKTGSVYAVELEFDNGVSAAAVHTLATDLNMPNGVAFRNGALFLAEVDRIWRYDEIVDHLANPPEPTLITDELPSDSHHGWKYIGFGPDDKLYVPIGVPCNVCDREGYGVMLRMNADGSGREIFARGIRNTVGFDWHPETEDLWFTDNGRDWMGDDTPPCELNHAPVPGMHFGFPFCHGGDIADPAFGRQARCDRFTPPARRLGPHVAPLGMAFYTGDMFPGDYRNQILIAEHGSWNRSKKIGYRVMLVRLDGNKAVSYEPFADGWLDGEESLGRPVDVLVLKDGSVLVSDDKNGAIYRITYEAAASRET